MNELNEYDLTFICSIMFAYVGFLVISMYTLLSAYREWKLSDKRNGFKFYIKKRAFGCASILWASIITCVIILVTIGRIMSYYIMMYYS